MNTPSRATFERLPIYYHYLKSVYVDFPEYISSSAIAVALHLGEVQVRKDLATICDGGKPKIGYKSKELLKALEQNLGFSRIKKAVLVGAGKLGIALMNYDGFSLYGTHIVAAFDIDKSKCTNDKIYLLESFDTFCKDNNVEIGIITTPPEKAQETCDKMISNGITAIWNFAQVRLNVPENIIVQNENLANSLAMLSAKLT